MPRLSVFLFLTVAVVLFCKDCSAMQYRYGMPLAPPTIRPTFRRFPTEAPTPIRTLVRTDEPDSPLVSALREKLITSNMKQITIPKIEVPNKKDLTRARELVARLIAMYKRP